MKTPLQLLYPDGTTSKDITGSLPAGFPYPIKYAEALLIQTNGVSIIRQLFSTHLCYLELYQFSCSQESTISFQVNERTFFLFFMLGGRVEFHSPDKTIIASTQTGWCYATFNFPEIYSALFPKGTHELLYLAIDSQWLERLSPALPALQPFIYSFLSGKTIYGVLGQHKTSAPLNHQLKKLFGIKSHTTAELEGMVQLALSRILLQYHEMLIKGRRQDNSIAFAALDYISESFLDPTLSNTKIAAALYTTNRTLIDRFYMEFKITPHAYLIHLRMRLAHDLLLDHKTPAKDVYIKVGYRDAHSFRVQFKHYFGYPPGESH